MKVDFSSPITDLAKNPIQINGEAMTLGSVSISSLLNERPEEKLKAEDKVHRFTLAEAIHGGDGEIEVRVEDIVLLKRLIADNWAPLVVGRAYALLPS